MASVIKMDAPDEEITCEDGSIPIYSKLSGDCWYSFSCPEEENPIAIEFPVKECRIWLGAQLYQIIEVCGPCDNDLYTILSSSEVYNADIFEEYEIIYDYPKFPCTGWQPELPIYAFTTNEVITRERKEDNEITLFPNPVNNNVYIESMKKITHFMVFSFQDKILLEGNVESNQLTFSANGWPSVFILYV